MFSRFSRPYVGLTLGLLMAAAAAVGVACSSSDDRRDRNYDTDAAADFGGPEAGFRLDSSTQSDKDADAGDDGALQNSDAAAKDTGGSADATADVGANDAAPTNNF